MESVSNVLSAGMGQWATIAPETTARIHELTGGYPWLVQTYGAGLVDQLNRERRTVATPDDVDRVSREAVLCNNELFAFWWPTEQLGPNEERFIEELFRVDAGDSPVTTRDYFSNVPHREQATFRKAFENLRACEVLDSTQTEILKFSGSVLRRWLEQQVYDGHLRIERNEQQVMTDVGQAGIFIDHENMIHSLVRIGQERGVDLPRLPEEKLPWLSGILKAMIQNAERRSGAELKYKVVAAFWSRPQEGALLPAYFANGFSPVQPEQIKMGNAVDFKVADEVRRAREQAMREGTRLSRAIIVTGDGDLSHAARALVNDGVAVQIWGGSHETNAYKYEGIVGSGNVIALDDVCGL